MRKDVLKKIGELYDGSLFKAQHGKIEPCDVIADFCPSELGLRDGVNDFDMCHSDKCCHNCWHMSITRLMKEEAKDFIDNFDGIYEEVQ